MGCPLTDHRRDKTRPPVHREACPNSPQTGSTSTSWAYAARASRSSVSPVRTVPSGSASATTSASAAEPRPARRRSSAALRASPSGTRCSRMHIFTKRFVLASRPGRLWSDSTRTTVGRTGGHSCSARSDRMRASARVERSARRLTPPLSRMSKAHPAWFTFRSRTRRTIASARDSCRAVGSPTSWASSAR